MITILQIVKTKGFKLRKSLNRFLNRHFVVFCRKTNDIAIDIYMHICAKMYQMG